MLQLENIISQHKNITPVTQSMIDGQKLPSIDGSMDHIIHAWRRLGMQLSQSIITNNIDLSLLDTLHQQLEQYGVWVSPFIGSGLSGDIHEDILLAYSLNLCIKRLSEIHHKAEAEPALGDLIRYLSTLQRFFPTLVKRIVPNLQQGLTVALHIVTAEVDAETEANSLLTMLQEVFATVSAHRLERRLNIE